MRHKNDLWKNIQFFTPAVFENVDILSTFMMNDKFMIFSAVTNMIPSIFYIRLTHFQNSFKKESCEAVKKCMALKCE